MTKADIVTDIAVETGLERNEALKAVEAFMTTIKSSLSKGENVYLRGFGSFIVKERAEKTDPQAVCGETQGRETRCQGTR